MASKKNFCWLLLLGTVVLILICNFPKNTKTDIDKIFQPPAVIADLTNGLGNQLFKFACNYALSKTLDIPLFVSSSKLEREKMFFMEDLKFIKDSTISAHNKQLFKFSDQDFLFSQWKIKQVLNSGSKFFYHHDFCQSELFFVEYKDEIVKMLTPHFDLDSIKPKVAGWEKAISDNSTESVAIHLRRGDFLEASTQGAIWVTPIPFYRKAMSITLDKFNRTKGKRVKFFVFSDGINYVKDNLINPNATATTTKYGIPDPPKVRKELKKLISKIKAKNVFYVSGNGLSSSEEFYLISKCKHAIISNSTFSWWAAYLIANIKKLVIGPAFDPSFYDHYKGEEERAFKRLIIGKYWYPKEWMVLDKNAYM